jgi:hypothetical protein
MVEEIVLKHVEKLNRRWCDHKLAEFRSSPLYDAKRDCLFYSAIRIEEDVEEELNEEGEVINRIVITEKEKEEIVTADFRQFCSSSNYYTDEGVERPYYLAELESDILGKPVKRYLYGLEEVAKELMSELKLVENELTPDTIWDFIHSTLQLIKTEFQAVLDGPKEVYALLRDDFAKLCEEQLYAIYEAKIYFNQIHGSNRDRLNINLNIENFSALLVLMWNADMLVLNKTTYDFFAKHVALKASNKTKIVTKRTLEQAVSKVRTFSGGHGLDRIKKEFNKPIRDKYS